MIRIPLSSGHGPFFLRAWRYPPSLLFIVKNGAVLSFTFVHDRVQHVKVLVKLDLY